tara:strand:- start:644 stop:799 length:156 start_codon:yes stop_codon:yes gene_type:complete
MTGLAAAQQTWGQIGLIPRRSCPNRTFAKMVNSAERLGVSISSFQAEGKVG